MRIGILQADSVLDQFQGAHGNYPGMIEQVVGEAATELSIPVSFETWDVEHGQYPSDVAECDGYIISGSKKSVYDDEPWIHELRAYTRQLCDQRRRLVGLCFGHQMVAEALGGKTEPAEIGWCVGVHDSRVRERQWFMEDDPDEYSLVVSHKDQVVRLPDGATLLASAQQCPNSMFCIEDHILAMQGHPEFTTAYSRALMDFREDILGPDTYRAGVDSLDGPLTRKMIGRWIVRFLKGKTAA